MVSVTVGLIKKNILPLFLILVMVCLFVFFFLVEIIISKNNTNIKMFLFTAWTFI